MSIFVSYKDIKQHISESTLKKGIDDNRLKGRNSWNHERVVGNTADIGKVMILFDSIPDRTKKKLPETLRMWEKIGNEFIQKATQNAPNFPQTAQTTQANVNVYVKLNENKEDIQFFYKNKVKEGQVREYVLASAALRFLSKIGSKADVKALNLSHIDTISQLQELVMSQVPEIRVSNLRVLQRKLAKYKEEGLKSLLPKNQGNTNAKVVTAKAEDLLISFYAGWDGIKRTIAGAHRRYMEIATGNMEYVDIDTGEVFKKDVPEISYESAKWLLTAPYIKEGIARTRHGQKYANDFIRWWIHRKECEYAFSLTSSDGWHLPFNAIVGGKVVSKRQKTFVAYPIFDAKTACIIAGTVSERENMELMDASYKNLVEVCWTKLGGKMPIENQLDNFGKPYKSELEGIFSYVSFCEPNRAQSKVAENYIGIVEEMVCREMPGWTGGNAGGVSDNFQVNPDKEKVGYENGHQLFETIKNKWNNMKMPSGRTRWEEMEYYLNPDCKPIEMQEAARMAGKTTVLEVKNSGSIKHIYKGVEIDYYIPEWSEILRRFRRDYRVRLKFLPFDRSKVWIYFFEDERDSSKDVFLCEAIPVPLSSKAKAETTDADKEALAIQMEHKHRTEKPRKEFEQNIKHYGVLEVIENVAIVQQPTKIEEDELPEAEEKEEIRTIDNGQSKYISKKDWKKKEV